jgi:chemotaxis signal transduction protein
VTRFSPEEVRSPLDHDIAAGLVPYLQGCIPQVEEILLVLDALAIADYDAMPEATPSAA